jgi:hypothetical protein
MNQHTSPHVPDRQTAVFAEGRRTGLAIAALAASIVAFINLLGMEKGILAVVLSVLALRGAAPATRARRLALAALGIAFLYVLTFVIVLILFHEKLGELIRMLQQLG